MPALDINGMALITFILDLSISLMNILSQYQDLFLERIIGQSSFVDIIKILP